MIPGSILGFTKSYEKCLFCKAKLKSRLTSFDCFPSDDQMPILNSHIDDKEEISCEISHTTPSYSLIAKVFIDIKLNTLALSVSKKDGVIEMPSIDKAVIKQVFLSTNPHIQLYCPKKDCPYDYTIASNICTLLKFPGIDKESTTSVYQISPCELSYESFVIDKFWVQNHFIFNKTYIYSLEQTDLNPITVALMSCKNKSEQSIINRVKTLIIFS